MPASTKLLYPRRRVAGRAVRSLAKIEVYCWIGGWQFALAQEIHDQENSLRWLRWQKMLQIGDSPRETKISSSDRVYRYPS